MFLGILVWGQKFREFGLVGRLRVQELKVPVCEGFGDFVLCGSCGLVFDHQVREVFFGILSVPTKRKAYEYFLLGRIFVIGSSDWGSATKETRDK